MGEGYWFWLIPLPTNQTSFGIVFDSNIHKFSEINTFDKALEWLRKHEPQAATLIENFKTDQKDFGCLKNYTCEAKEVFSASNWAITGEAGVFIDPFYSPGSDFIAIANTYITDLISRSHAGEDVGFRAKLYNKIFLKLYTGTKFTFKDQYEIMGNPLVMPIKVFWDWCFYWNFIARLYFDEKYTDLRYLSKMENVIAQAEALNIKIQDLLNRWNKKERPEIKSGFLDLAGYPYLYGLNAALSEKFEGSDSEFKTEERFKLGICNLELIASEIQNMYDDTDAWDSEPKLEASLNVRNFYKELRGFCDECN